MTSSPVAKPVTPPPVAATTPARSLPCPDGNVAGHRECSRPSRILASPGLIPAALTWTSTWPGPGTGVGTSTTLRTSMSPYSSNRTAFISLPPFSQDASTSETCSVCPPAVTSADPLRMSVPEAKVSSVAERWDRERVLALAPDAPSQLTAQSLASGRAWTATGATAEADAVWGECRGSASAPYRAVVDLTGPAFRCSCPSRKFPCKHVLALLLLWSDGSVPDDAAGPPDWAGSWLMARAATAGRAPSGGLAELDRWLCDQARQGLAASQQAGYAHWDDIAARMVDAQAPGVAERLRALASVPHSGPGWDGRLLEEYALLHLLAVAYRRQAELPGPLRGTVRSRIGFSLRQADVLASGQPIRDHWQVLARRDLEQDRIRARRTWLRGRKTGRDALLLSFAAAGQALDDSLTVGTGADADLVFYPGAVALRAAVLTRHGDGAVPADGGPPEGGTIAALLAGYAG